MFMEVDDKVKIAYYWFSKEEKDDKELRESLRPEYRQWNQNAMPDTESRPSRAVRPRSPFPHGSASAGRLRRDIRFRSFPYCVVLFLLISDGRALSFPSFTVYAKAKSAVKRKKARIRQQAKTVAVVSECALFANVSLLIVRF